MREFKSYRTASATILIIISLVVVFTKCMNEGADQAAIKNPDGREFAESATCAGCHKDIYEKHLQTAHYLTTRIAARQYIQGSFEPGENSYSYDMDRKVVMEEIDSSFYQVGYNKASKREAHRIDIVIGSGTMGQSYLSWRSGQLFQLPITYFSAAHQWSNSPGYPNKIIFNRPITSRCLECHSSFAKTISAEGTEPEKFDPAQMIYGVDCEKCHGPALEHVQFQTGNPTVLTAKYIINPSRLSRQQNLDLCASCHGGRLKKTRPSFGFMVGDTLSHFFELDTIVPNHENIDVHGNQYGLLRTSKCFMKSETLTCNTCHNTHENEKGKTALFSQRCMSCHSSQHGITCKMSNTIGTQIKTNCIDCHMPLQSSRAIAVYLPGGSAPVAALIRSHYISIYPDEVKKVRSFMQRTN